MTTHFTIFTADHGPEADVSTETISRLVRIDLLRHSVLVDTNVLCSRRLRALLVYRIFSLLGRWFSLAAPHAHRGATILAGGNRTRRGALAASPCRRRRTVSGVLGAWQFDRGCGRLATKVLAARRLL
jgi:hypothetical protein